jgi:hypothetical protein
MNWKKVLILLGVSFFSVGVFLFWSSQVYRLGYPLDDAWIHQTFARNLARFHELSYFKGIPTAGSTAPLWTVFLSVGYLFSGNNYLWTMLLGLIFLFLLGCLGEWIFQKINPEYNSWFPWAGVILVLEWHLVWAAASGMETLFLAAIILAVFSLLLTPKPPWLILGLMIGAGVWVRPDAITLIGPTAMVLGIGIWKGKYRWIHIAWLLGGFILPILPYLLFNYSIAGNFWPNTFFAKQMEYRELLAQPITFRLGTVFGQHLVGIGILLLPGFVYKIWISIRERNWVILAFVIWWLGFLLLYAIRLPVSYQHGRYEIPIMPIFFLIAGAGVFSISQMAKLHPRCRLLVTAWVISIFVVDIGFFFIGARTYANDVAIIDSEMVDTAKWIDQNTPGSAIIAAHDIGALGYFGNRRILDLAGLISPEVIPFIRDEKKLNEYINRSSADYLMTFPDWYPMMSQQYQAIFTSSGIFAPPSGGENMVVYIIKQAK